MLIGPFDTAPFIELRDQLNIPSRRNVQSLDMPCQKCLLQFRAIGKELTEFTQTVGSDRDLFEFLAITLRAAKNTNFKFESAAQLHSELGSIRNAIKRIQCGSVKETNYELSISFSNAVESCVQMRVEMAA